MMKLDIYTRRGIALIIAPVLGAAALAAPAGATQGDERPATIDSNGDGKPDAWDTNGDGQADAWDTDGDGKPDMFDRDGDGKPDKPSAE